MVLVGRKIWPRVSAVWNDRPAIWMPPFFLPDLSRQFGSEKIDFLDDGRSRQQRVGLRHKLRGDSAPRWACRPASLGD